MQEDPLPISVSCERFLEIQSPIVTKNHCRPAQFLFLQGSALGLMVGWMSFGNRKFEHLDAKMRHLIPRLQETMLALVPMIDADTNAFNEYMVGTLVLALLSSTKRDLWMFLLVSRKQNV